jgi:hypothetical protein
MALHTNIRRYVTGLDVNGVNLDASPEWWWDVPFTPMAVWFVGSVAFGLVLVAAVARFLPAKTAAVRLATKDPSPSRTSNAAETRGKSGQRGVG